jgi:hypothetical protein
MNTADLKRLWVRLLDTVEDNELKTLFLNEAKRICCHATSSQREFNLEDIADIIIRRHVNAKANVSNSPPIAVTENVNISLVNTQLVTDSLEKYHKYLTMQGVVGLSPFVQWSKETTSSTYKSPSNPTNLADK